MIYKTLSCPTICFPSNPLDIPIRLLGSSVPNAGRIDVLYAGVWGAISGENWDIDDATVVCRQLGYPAGAEAALKTVVYGLVRGPVWLTNLQCTGSEASVIRCAYDVIGNKTEQQKSYYTAGVICKDLSLPSGNVHLFLLLDSLLSRRKWGRKEEGWGKKGKGGKIPLSHPSPPLFSSPPPFPSLPVLRLPRRPIASRTLLLVKMLCSTNALIYFAYNNISFFLLLLLFYPGPGCSKAG